MAFCPIDYYRLAPSAHDEVDTRQSMHTLYKSVTKSSNCVCVFFNEGHLLCCLACSGNFMELLQTVLCPPDREAKNPVPLWVVDPIRRKSSDLLNDNLIITAFFT